MGFFQVSKYSFLPLTRVFKNSPLQIEDYFLFFTLSPNIFELAFSYLRQLSLKSWVLIFSTSLLGDIQDVWTSAKAGIAGGSKSVPGTRFSCWNRRSRGAGVLSPSLQHPCCPNSPWHTVGAQLRVPLLFGTPFMHTVCLTHRCAGLG